MFISLSLYIYIYICLCACTALPKLLTWQVAYILTEFAYSLI